MTVYEPAAKTESYPFSTKVYILKYTALKTDIILKL